MKKKLNKKITMVLFAKKILFVRFLLNIFKESALGRFFHRGAMSVYISVYLSIYLSICPLFM